MGIPSAKRQTSPSSMSAEVPRRRTSAPPANTPRSIHASPTSSAHHRLIYQLRPQVSSSGGLRKHETTPRGNANYRVPSAAPLERRRLSDAQLAARETGETNGKLAVELLRAYTHQLLRPELLPHLGEGLQFVEAGTHPVNRPCGKVWLDLVTRSRERA